MSLWRRPAAGDTFPVPPARAVMHRWLVCLLFLLYFCGLNSQAASLKGTRPNVIFFLADDQGKFDHSAYGNTNAPTPITQAFSEEGLVFDRAYTGQAICAPSRSMLYTGRYTIRNGCFINHSSIRPRMKSLPDYLAPLGYTVVLAGKSHVKPDAQFPWTHYFPPVDTGLTRPWIPVDEIEAFLANSGPDPFCMVVASEFPHGPYDTNTPYTVDDVLLPPYIEDTEANRTTWAQYYSNIDQKELEFAAVLNAIQTNGLASETLVFYSDDHGTRRGKYTVYDSGLNVAFMVRWPGKIAPGRIRALATFADFVPTVIELAGGTWPAGIDGKSLLPLLEGTTTNHHDYVYGVTVNQGIIDRHVFPQRSVHDGRYHYIHNFNSQERIDREGITNYFYEAGAQQHPLIPEEELYDTLSDPHEMTNLAAQTGMTAIKDGLKAELFRWMADDQYDYLVENESSLFLDTPSNPLDETDDGYSLPAEQVGVLAGLKVDPHAVTDPNAGLEVGIVDFNADQMPGAHNDSVSATLDETTPEVTSLTDPGYAGQPIYRGFQEEGVSLWSANTTSSGGLKIRWNAGSGVVGEKSSGLFLFKREDFLGTMDSGTAAYTICVKGTVSYVSSGGTISNTTVRVVLKDNLGYHISAPVIVSSHEVFSMELPNLEFFAYNPLLNTATEAGRMGGSSVPTFVDIGFIGFRLDADRGANVASGVNFGLTEFEVSSLRAYGSWVLEYNLFGDMVYDEDRDGFNNLYEYAFGGNPTNPADTGRVPNGSIESSSGNNVFKYVFARRKGSEGELDYVLETRTNLVAGTWISCPVESVEAGRLDDGFEGVTNRIGTTPGVGYLRLRVEGK